MSAQTGHINGKKTIPSIAQLGKDLEDGFDQIDSAVNDEPRPTYHAYKIDLSEELPAPPVAMYIKDENNLELTTLFTKGNFSIVTGPPKQRKTFLVNMLLAEAVGKKHEFFHCPSNGISIGFDTEQAKYKVQQNGKRIVRLAGTEENLHLYSLRTLEPHERLELIEQVLQDTPNLNFVVIDGIIDLDIDPILQADQAQNIVQKLMRWSEEHQVHICCVLHFNKTVATLLGHLGSFSHRKADAIISVTKDKDNENISIVEAVDTREKPFKPFAFSINEEGLPYIIGEHQKEDNKGKKALQPKDVPQETHRKHLLEIFEVSAEYGYKDLLIKIKLKYAEYGIEFGESKAKEFLSYCENLGMLAHNGKQGKAAKYSYVPVKRVGSRN